MTRVLSTMAAVTAFVLLVVQPGARAQSGRGDHWVGTWATAVVTRPQGPALALPGSSLGSREPSPCRLPYFPYKYARIDINCGAC